MAGNSVPSGDKAPMSSAPAAGLTKLFAHHHPAMPEPQAKMAHAQSNPKHKQAHHATIAPGGK